MKKLHILTEKAIAFTFRGIRIALQDVYTALKFTLKWTWKPIEFILAYLWLIIEVFYQRFAYEIFVVCNVIIFALLAVIAIYGSKAVDYIERRSSMPIEEIIEREVISAIHSLDIYPFSEFKKYEQQLASIGSELYEYKIKAAELPEPIDQFIEREAAKANIPSDLAWGIINNENPKLDQYAFYAGNRDGSLDTGIMQVNSKNFKYCGITARDAFNPTINVRCGMKILRNALSEAKRLANKKQRPISCTGATTEKELVEEYAARIYNGGSGVFEKGNTSCKYAGNLRRYIAGIDPLPEVDDIVVSNIPPEDRADFEEEESFWARIF